MKKIVSLLICLCYLMLSPAYAVQDINKSVKSRYHISSETHIKGSGGWDYLTFNKNKRQLFITFKDTGVKVINVDTKKIIGTIKNTKNAHGVALVPEFKLGFTSNGASNTVTMFNINTLKPVKEIKVGSDPDCITYDVFTKRIFVINGDSGDATAIDASSGKVVGTVKLDSNKPEFAVSDDKGTLYINLCDKNQILAIDTKSLKEKTRWATGNGAKPTALAIDKESGNLFIGCRSNLMVIMDSSNGNIISELPIDPKVDAVAYDPVTQFVFSANGSGSITVIKKSADNKYAVVDTVLTKPGARTMALDPDTHNIYTVTAKLGAPVKAGGRPTIIPDTFEMYTISGR